jgi:hypothetical protein
LKVSRPAPVASAVATAFANIKMKKAKSGPNKKPIVVTQPDLEAQFQELSAKSIEAHEKYIGADDDISTILSKDYLLWRKLSEQRHVLDKLYTLEGFPASSGQNDPDFAPYIKILFRLELPNPTQADKERALKYGSRRNKVSRYVAVLEALHKEYGDHQEDFKFNAAGKLKQFVEKRGGVFGITADRAAANASAKIQSNGLTAIGQPEDDIERAHEWIADHALPILKIAPSIVWSSTLAPESLTWSEDGHALISVRRNSAGSIEYGPTSIDAAPLTAVAVDQVSKLSNIQDLSLRLLAEVTATQSYPAKFCPKGGRANLTGACGKWWIDHRLDTSPTSRGLPVNRRLVVRQSDILLSAMQSNSSVVTILTPLHKLLAPTDADVYLAPDELRLIEEWYETKTLAARKVMPSSSLRISVKGKKADRFLKVSNIATKRASLLHFWHIDRADDDPIKSHQADLSLSNYKPNWKFAARREWFLKLRSEFLDRWFEMVRGNQLSRRENALFNIGITRTKLTIYFKRDSAGRCASETIDLGRPASTRASVTKASVSFSVSAKDLAIALYNIANLDIDGPVKISGDDAVVLLKFKTASGKYLIAIPTATASKNSVIRNPKHLTRYGKAVI